MATIFRNPREKLPIVHIVSPAGDVEAIQYAKGIGGSSSRKIVYEGGKAYLSNTFREMGYITLEEAFEAESNPQLREDGLKMYRDWFEAAKELRAPREEKQVGPDKTRKVPKAYPEEYLPEEVRLRKTGKSSVSQKTFKLPKLKKAAS